MTKTLGLIGMAIILLTAFNCCNHSAKSPAKASQENKDSVGLKKASVSSWMDSLIINYVKNSNNKLIKESYNDTAPVKWITDTVTRDGVSFITVRIGYDNSFSFVTSGWLYIDSLKRKIYEYDLGNDSLILWQAPLDGSVKK